MPWEAFAVAAGAAFLITSVELRAINERHPFGKTGLRAVSWWCLIAAIDGAIAALLIAGAIPAEAEPEVAELGIAGWVMIGLLGPLGLRSPIREVQVGDKPEPVGITYVYDLIRIPCARALDERITRMRRTDRSVILDDLEEMGWQARPLSGAISLHAHDRRTIDADAVDVALASALTLPHTDEKLEGVVNVMLNYKLKSLLEEVRGRGPAAPDRRAGSRLRKPRQ